MLGIFDLMPFLKGWGYKPKVWTREVTRGQPLEVERIEDAGWLLYAYVGSDDAYGGFSLDYQGADLSLFNSGNVNAQALYDLGAATQDPGGFVQKYYRPNPQSTAGAYFSCLTSMGFQGTTWPHVPTTIVTLRLENASTQQKATVIVSMGRVVIVDRKQFIRSLRAVTGMPTIQDIDPALLVAGSQEITAKGEFDKEKENK